MRKLYAIGIALLCFALSIGGIDWLSKQRLQKNKEKAIYQNSDEVRTCDYMMEEIVDDSSIVVFGSSELSASDDIAYPPALFNMGYSDYNMVLIGHGYEQSLQHTIKLGALQDDLKGNKLVLILSPQWFTDWHLSPEIFSSKFEERTYVEFLKNDSISDATKARVEARVNELLAADTVELEKVEKYEEIYLNHTWNPIDYVEVAIYDWFMNAKQRLLLANQLDEVAVTPDYDNYVKVEEIDFNALKEEAEAQGQEECTNNEFGVYDEYYDTYMRESLESEKNADVNASYSVSKEYDDLKLFLDLCKEIGVEPLLVNIPVNGRWYDYTGFSKENREQYYQNIRQICADYQVELADFSDKEYELYFLKDIMHLGWKGWAYLDEAVYQFYKK